MGIGKPVASVRLQAYKRAEAILNVSSYPGLYRINDPFVTELTFHGRGKVLWAPGVYEYSPCRTAANLFNSFYFDMICWRGLAACTASL